MDPTKLDGRIKEVVRLEHKSRTNFQNVWRDIASSEINRFYHQDEQDKRLREKLDFPEPDSKGQAHFISAEMRKHLLDTCRCGRPKRGIHLTKCLQRAVDTPHRESSKAETLPKMPQTSSSFIGLKSAPYQTLEQSMQYRSPTISMPGPRITAAPYNAIIIG